MPESLVVKWKAPTPLPTLPAGWAWKNAVVGSMKRVGGAPAAQRCFLRTGTEYLRQRLNGAGLRTHCAAASRCFKKSCFLPLSIPVSDFRRQSALYETHSVECRACSGTPRGGRACLRPFPDAGVRPLPQCGSPPARPDVQKHRDRKSTRLNSSHVASSYAVFCL